MSEREVIMLLGSIVALGGLLTLLMQFTVKSTFTNLQGQINDLRDYANRQNAKIDMLQESVDDWQRKYHTLDIEYTKIILKHEQLQDTFNDMQKHAHAQSGAVAVMNISPPQITREFAQKPEIEE